MAYLLDANVFMQARNLHYGFDFCPAFWDWLERENAAGKVFSIEKVQGEMVDEELSAWASQRGSGFFLAPDDQVVASLATVSRWATGAHYDPAAVSTFLQIADYYLVGHALACGHTVVTHEIAGTSSKRIKIPDACVGVGVKCITPFEMLRVARARFVLARGPQGD